MKQAPLANRIMYGTRRLVWLALLLPGLATAHEFEPAILTFSESADGSIGMLWKVPARHAEHVAVMLPADCVVRQRSKPQSSGTMQIEQWSIDCAGPVTGTEIGVTYRRQIPMDVLLQVRPASGGHWSTVLTGLQPTAEVPAASSTGYSFREYFKLGVDHILLGWDHLLFVLGLLLVVTGFKRLLLTVTGFTIGHSMTLGFAALGWLVVPSRPVEICIALSVVLLAREAIVGPPDSVTRRLPWLVASGFGLLHGLGFGSALLEIGLPEQGLWHALLAFNIGVEVGQLVFIALVLFGAHLMNIAWRSSATVLRPAWLGYPMGIVAMFWVLERATQ